VNGIRARGSTLESCETYRIQIMRRPCRGGRASPSLPMPWCRRPRRHVYLLTRVGAKFVDYLGLRCQDCAGLRFGSRGRYITRAERASSHRSL